MSVEAMDDTLYLQLHKLSSPPASSEETLEHVLDTLWRSRKTGLKTPEKSYLQSLLNLPSLQELDPVLACLRSLIRKNVHDNFTGDDLLKLFPTDLSLDLQNSLVVLLQKYQSKWKEEASRDQTPWQRTSISYQVKVGVPPSFIPSTAADISASMWPRQDDATLHFSHSDISNLTPIVSDTDVASLAPLSSQQVDGSDLGILPRLKSMTWTMENRKSKPSERVAVINLKLQDYTKSPSGEREVKFQLTRDALEAMLRSMAYISEQLTNIAEPSAGPSQKKQRQ